MQIEDSSPQQQAAGLPQQKREQQEFLRRNQGVQNVALNLRGRTFGQLAASFTGVSAQVAQDA